MTLPSSNQPSSVRAAVPPAGGRVATAMLATGLLAAGLSSQLPVDILHGKSENSQYGSSVACAGDVDGDGYPDLIVGAAIDCRVCWKNGALEVRSGRTRELLYTWLGAGPGDELGFAGAGAGDVDGDGHDDILVACIGGVGAEKSFVGHARVYSGRTGQRLHVFLGENEYDFYGISVGGVGDLDGDGHADLAIGCPGFDGEFHNMGRLEIHSGETGALLHLFLGESADDQFGWFCRNVGDIDGDGVGELLIGAPGHLITGADGKPTKTGYVEVHSGRTGELLRKIRGEGVGDRFGWNVSAIGDLDRDGKPDLLIGAPFRDVGDKLDAGAFYVCSGATGERLLRVESDEAGAEFGWCVFASADHGDYDHDGVPDMWVTARHADANGVDSGSAALFSGADGHRLLELTGRSAGDEYGYSLVDLGPVPGAERGAHEVVIGARSDDVATGAMVGTANIYRVVPAAAAGQLPEIVDGTGRVETYTAEKVAPTEAPEWFRKPEQPHRTWLYGAAAVGVIAIGLFLFTRNRRG
ncbi:MAG: FG-GAP repeat protein [Planctomycetes bacterium]|nr:FG-GAP repeat protein [Planctomycetota bacterium]